MDSNILNPLQVIQKVNLSLPTQSVLISRKRDGGLILDEVRYRGRDVDGERVNIYAHFLHKENIEKTPAVLLLGERSKSVDYDLMKYFAQMGYSVLMPDYRGETKENSGRGNYTLYPNSISYANFEQSDDHLFPNGDSSVLETAWFEWLSVGKFSIDFLRSVTKGKIGLAGIRSGGELVWKLSLLDGIACSITMSAIGWIAYHGESRYALSHRKLSENDLKFIAGMDSEAYAPFVNKPILILGTGRDEWADMDRAYDSYSRIPKTVEKTISYSVRNDKYLGNRVQNDIELFFSKHLDGREVFIPSPAELSVSVNKKGALEAKITFDETSSVERCGLYIVEGEQLPSDREWRRVNLSSTEEDGKEIYMIPICEETKVLYLCAFYGCSNGFTASSRVVRFEVKRKLSYTYPRSKILYSGRENADLFYSKMPEENLIADYLLKAPTIKKPELKKGYGGIEGVECKDHIESYLVGMEKFRADESSLFAFDAYSEENTSFFVTFYRREGNEVVAYRHAESLSARGKWKKFVLKPTDFSLITNVSRTILSSFSDVFKISFETKGKEFLVNNLIWI